MARSRVAHITSELAPLARTGGLGDAVAALARAQEAAGIKPLIFLPYYREIRLASAFAVEPVIQRLPLHIAPGIRQEISLMKGTLPGSKVPVYLVDHARSFDRDHLYGTPEGDYPDNADRFILLSRAALQCLKELKEEVDVVHAHDWQAALVPAFLRKVYATEDGFTRTASVFTIHNLAYQGQFLKDVMPRTGLGWEMFTPDQLEFYGKVNFMKAGILYADKIATVSPTYAEEILTKEGGFGLDGLLTTRSADVAGILNGVDAAEWDPQSDKLIPATFSRRNPAGKAACREALLREFGLEESGSGRTLVAGVVARFAEQKGFDLLIGALPKLAKKRVRIVVLGNGEKAIREALEDAARRHPETLAVQARFDHALAHRVYAGSDAFLMPSKYEPCGLSQLIAMRYGTLPIARAVGGLVDTITPVDDRKKTGTGFLFRTHTADAFAKSVEAALGAYEDEPLWKKLVSEAMGEDFSWEPAVKKYETLYDGAQKKRAKR